MIEPHGGRLVKAIAEGEKGKELLEKAENLYTLEVPFRYLSDCEMIAIGGYSPLSGFMTKDEVMSVLENVALTDGTVWAIPVVLPISRKVASEISVGDKVVLTEGGKPIAIVKVSEKYTLDKEYYCEKVFKTTDINHPGVRWFMESGDVFLAGDVVLLNRPRREVDEKYYLDPEDTRKEFERRGWKRIVAFQTRNPIHRAHEYLIKCALEAVDGALIHPLVGETKADDIPAAIRMKCYEVLIGNYFNKERVLLSVLPASMRYAGPREAVHHMITRKNYGCTHMIIGRDHAGVGNYYGTYEAQEFVDKFVDRLGIEPVKFEHAFYCTVCESMATAKTCPHPKEKHVLLSGTKVREMLKIGKKPPKEFTRPEIANVLVRFLN